MPDFKHGDRPIGVNWTIHALKLLLLNYTVNLEL